MPLLEINFDSTSPPYDLYHKLHTGDHTHARVQENGHWLIYRYSDVLKVLKDHHNFSAIAVRDLMCPLWLDKSCHRSDFIVMQDPPESDNNRKIINRLFVKRAIDALTSTMINSADTLALTFPNEGSFTRLFSYPYICKIMNTFLGVNFEPSEIETWINAVENITPYEPHNKQQIVSSIEKQRSQFRTLILERRNAGQEGCAISRIICSHGNQLSDDDLLNILELLVGAGFHTTIHMLDEIIIFLTENPETKKQITESRDLIPLFVDEMLRLYATVHYEMRQAINDVELSGFTIKAGEKVRVMLAAANRDPKVFSSPKEFNLFRHNNNQHLAFGAGAHICLGSALAHKELCIAVDALLKHLTSVEIVRDQSEKVTMPNILGVNSLVIKRKL